MSQAHRDREALEILAQGPVHVIVTDMWMPRIGGFDLLKIVKQDYPHVVRVILSGYTQTAVLLTAINQGEIFRFIPKPWKSNEGFKTTIRQAIEFYDLHSEREMLMKFFELWVEGVEPESIQVGFLRELVAERRKHLHEWRDRYGSGV